MNIYLSFLLKEIENFNHIDNILEWLYFWGWTPTSFSPEELNLIISKLKEKFIFKDNFEFTLETTPANVNLEDLKKWKNLWVTRISMWVQSLNNKTLKEVTRENNLAIFNALDTLEWNFDNVNCDFIIGLPYMRKWETTQNIKELIEKYSCIKHISPYMLEDYDYSPTWKENSIDETEYQEEYTSVIDFLDSVWFKKYELSNTAKKWFECLHNIAYWEHKNVIWFWLDAGSFLDWKRFWNSDNFKKYYLWKWGYSEILTKEEINQEKIIFWIRWRWCDKNLLENKKLEKAIKDWFLEEKYWRIYIKKWNESLIDYIISEVL